MSPSCDNVRLLERFADDECPSQEAADLERHLSDCEACREEVRALRALATTLSHTLEDSPLGEGIAQRLAQSVAQATGATMEAKTAGSSYGPHVAAATAALDSRRQRSATPESSATFNLPTQRLYPLSWLLPVAACAAVAIGLKVLDQPAAPLRTQRPVSPTIAQWQGHESGASLHVRQAGGDFRPTIRGHALTAGAEVWNQGRVGTFVDLSDGSRIALSPGARVRLATADRVDVIASQGASIFCEVTPRQKGRRAFTVTSDNTTITVLGTRFSVRSSTRSVRVTVLEGRVHVSSPLEMRYLGVGEAATVDTAAGRVDMAPAQVQEAVSWIPGYESYQLPAPGTDSEPGAPARIAPRGPAHDTPAPADGSADMPVLPPGRPR